MLAYTRSRSKRGCSAGEKKSGLLAESIARAVVDLLGLADGEAGLVPAQAFGDGGEVGAEAGGGLGVVLDPYAAGRAAAERLQPVGAAAGEEVEESRPGEPARQTGEHGLSHAVGRRPHGIALRDQQGDAPGLSPAYAHGNSRRKSCTAGRPEIGRAHV